VHAPRPYLAAPRAAGSIRGYTCSRVYQLYIVLYAVKRVGAYMNIRVHSDQRKGCRTREGKPAAPRSLKPDMCASLVPAIAQCQHLHASPVNIRISYLINLQTVFISVLGWRLDGDVVT